MTTEEPAELTIDVGLLAELASLRLVIERQAAALGAIRAALRRPSEHLAVRAVKAALRDLDNRPAPGTGVLPS